MSRFLLPLYDAALALFYPRTCKVCSKPVATYRTGPACDQCWAETEIFTEQTFSYQDPGMIYTVYSIGKYELALRATVLELKHEPYVPTRLSDLMFETWQRKPLNTSTLIIPVPLHPERYRKRGFNQSYILAQALSKRTKVPVETSSLIRTVHTDKYRTGMDTKSRKESVINAFKVQHPRIIEGENILLIDDVFTTGATVSACASVLKESGAQEIFILTVARTR
jgi:ComF family protein